MKRETVDRLRKCRTVKANTFATKRGVYKIAIMLHENGDLYFLKVKDGELCEFSNLNDIVRKGCCDCGK